MANYHERREEHGERGSSSRRSYENRTSIIRPLEVDLTEYSRRDVRPQISRTPRLPQHELSNPLGAGNPLASTRQASGDSQREEAQRALLLCMEKSERRIEHFVLSVALCSLLLAIGEILALMLFSIATSSKVSENFVPAMVESKIRSRSSSDSYPTPAPTTSDENSRPRQIRALATGVCLAISATFALFSCFGLLLLYFRSLYSSILAIKAMETALKSFYALIGVSVLLMFIALCLAMSILYPNYDSDFRNKGVAAGLTCGAVLFSSIYTVLFTVMLERIT